MAATCCAVCQFRAISEFIMEQPRAGGLLAIGINSFFVPMSLRQETSGAGEL